MENNGKSPQSSAEEGELRNYLIRMITPMRREFARSLDIAHFLHDFAYAKEIIEQAKSSQDERLRKYAEHLESRVLGPRNAEPPGTFVTKAPHDAIPPTTADAKTANQLSADELRSRMLSKYKSGLR